MAKKKKYFWTPEQDAMLRRAYQVRSKGELTKAVGEVMRRTGYPRYILQNRAAMLGLRLWRCNTWTEEDMIFLRALAGTMRPWKIAKELGRSEFSVKNKLFQLGLETGITEGYSRNEVADLMGVHHCKLTRWIAKGWLKADEDDRLSDAEVRRFLWEHMEEYRFAACEEWWLKQMLKPSRPKDVLDIYSDAQTRRKQAA